MPVAFRTSRDLVKERPTMRRRGCHKDPEVRVGPRLVPFQKDGVVPPFHEPSIENASPFLFWIAFDMGSGGWMMFDDTSPDLHPKAKKFLGVRSGLPV